MPLALGLGVSPVFGGGFASGAAVLAGPYADAVAVDFRDGSMLIKDAITPANNFSGRLFDRLPLTRTTPAWYVDDSNVLRRSEAGLARLTPNRGMLIEQASTNYILDNSAFIGAAVGVIGSGGAIPASWTGFSAVAGITREVVAIGTLANGMPYIDLKLSGTNSSGSTGWPDLYFRPHTGNVAASGEKWSGSFYAQIVSGSRSGFANAATACRVCGRDAGGNFVEYGAPPPGTEVTDAGMATFRRLVSTYTLANASSVNASVFLDLSIPAGNTVNVTYRIALPQLEKSSLPTSPILTTGATVTRNADDIAGLLSSAFNLSQTVGTLFASGKTEYTDKTNSNYLVVLNDGSFSNRGLLRRQPTTGAFNSAVVIASAFDGQPSDFPGTDNTHFKFAAAWAANDMASTLNGAVVNTDATLTPPTSLNRIEFGKFLGDSQANMWIKQILYVPQRLSNAALQALTT